jgi:thioredoxin-like negative regulator of GroEL
MTLLKFYANYCQPCKTLTKTLQEKFSDNPMVQSAQAIDIEADFKTAAKYRVRSLPTLIVVDTDGNEVRRLVNPSADKLEEFLK